MLKRKCPGCARKIDRSYNFCPWCGESIKSHKEKENFGLLGRNDNSDSVQNQNNLFQGLPFGIEKMMGPLIKQLEKELSNIEKQNAMPRGFNIKIQTGLPEQLKVEDKQNKERIVAPRVSIEESKRRQGLPKEEAESRVKRLSDKIIYEIEAPGVKEKSDISISNLEKGFEIKVYTKNKCYTKTIPLQIEIENYSVKKDKVIVELKN